MKGTDMALTPEQAAIADALSTALHCSVEDVVRMALEDFAEAYRYTLSLSPEVLESWVFPRIPAKREGGQ